MDEDDVDSREEINDLEARLYAQVHHESNDADELVPGSAACDNVMDRLPTPPTIRKVTATSVVNKPMGTAAGRYWNKGVGKNPIKLSSIPKTNIKSTTTAGVVKNIAKIDKNSIQSTKNTGSPKSSFSSINTNKTRNEMDSVSEKDVTFQSPTPREPISTSSSSKVENANQNVTKSNSRREIDSENLSNKTLRFNPASKKKQHNPKAGGAAPSNASKNAPFTKRVQKLDKAKRIEAKRQKSKTVKNKSKLSRAAYTITLESTDESDDDVIAIPVPPPPTYTIEDSDEQSDNENEFSENNNCSDVLAMEDNAQDANDVTLGAGRSAAKTGPTLVNETQPPQNNSRCTSPSSIISSDDFIGQNDRCRLLEKPAMADDEDLIVLTADFDSLLEAPNDRSQRSQQNSKPNDSTKESTSNEMQATQLTTPSAGANKAGTKNKNQYRVELSEFRALDVYDSESDKEENANTRRGPSNNATIIRFVNSSSDEDNIQSVVKVREKLKHLHKRHSGGNKGRGNNNDHGTTHSDNDFELGDGKAATPVGFIVQGPALESCKRKRCSISQSSMSSSRIASAGDGMSVGQMSDNEFIATINTLAQAGTDGPDRDATETGPNDNSDDDDFDDAAVPSARTIAEQVLAAKNKKNQPRQTRTAAGVVTERRSSAAEDETAERRTTKAMKTTTAASINPRQAVKRTAIERAPNEREVEAIPVDSLSHLNNIFKAIDNYDDRHDINSDDSDYDVEILEPVTSQFVKAVTGIQAVPATSFGKLKRETGDPVYNIVYSNEKRFAGGLGWNDEMRRFYNDSWKGERFSVRNILRRMNPEKSLWKIYTEDRYPKTRRFTNQKCYNCCEFGHTRAKCTRPRKPLICYMCGEHGHYEPRCPNTICLRCGNKTQVYTKSCGACNFQNRLICPVCKVRGHTLNLCPDKWRRYHSTTIPNVYPNNDVEYKKKKFCCVCAGRGHLADTCKNAVRFLEYPLFVSSIKSHHKSYNDQSFKTSVAGIGFNLMYRPEQDISFALAEHTTIKDCYGRFLESVGMAYLLKRKRKADAVASKPPTKQAPLSCSTTLETCAPLTSTSETTAENIADAFAPEQVQEISESGNVDNTGDAPDVVNLLTCPDEDQIMREDENNDTEQRMEAAAGGSNEGLAKGRAAFKKPALIDDNAQTSQTSKEQPEQQPEVMLMDSDSNYSFSEHFGIQPTTSTALGSKPRSREMEPLPDFIPIGDGSGDDDDDDEEGDLSMQLGISRTYANKGEDGNNEGENRTATNPLPDVPSEAKIYLTHFHSRYLLSPSGHQFLVAKSKECDIKARLDWTSVGHVLIIFGLQSDQDNFHRELLLRYRQLTDQMNKKRADNMPKVPRRADVLIRFLRENINQLMTNLGNVNDHLKRLRSLQDQQHSKSGWKMAEKLRRLLNMILVGQAGLHNGNMHLDKLLLSLKMLINDYKDEDIVPTDLRDEVDMHWKFIFTSYKHDNYNELVEHYNRMLSKNRIPKLNIDPVLLGSGLTDLNPTKDYEKQHSDQPSSKHVKEKRCSIVPNPFNPKNSKRVCKSPPPPVPSMTMKAPSLSSNSVASSEPAMKFINKRVISNFLPPTNSLKLKNFSTAAPLMNPQQKSAPSVATRIKEVSQKWENTCDTLLDGIDVDSKKRNGPDRDCKAPSMFWSRESLKYLDECMKKVNSNGNLMEKLQRVAKKSQTGQLSYNDYRAIIKIHNAIMGK